MLIVKIFIGCLGLVIFYIYVLIFVYCVYDGVCLFELIVDLKVGILWRYGKLCWIGVKSINFFEMWCFKNILVSFDYVVIIFFKFYKWFFFKFGVIENEGYFYKLYFVSFFGDKKFNLLWYSYCYFWVIFYLLIGRCDVFFGSFGVGIYVRIFMKENG